MRDGRRGAIGLGLVIWAALLAAVALRAWRPPGASPAGVVLLLSTGLGLGVCGLVSRPPPRARLAALAALVAAAMLLDVLWWPWLDAAKRVNRLAFQRHADSGLASRYARHRRTTRSWPYFVLEGRLQGKEVRWVEGSRLEPWLLYATQRVASVRRMEPPASLPSAASLRRRYGAALRTRRGAEMHVVGITEGAEVAKYFVVVVIDGRDFVIPDAVWEDLGT